MTEIEKETIKDILLESGFTETKYLFFKEIIKGVFLFEFYYVKEEFRFYVTLRDSRYKDYISEQRLLLKEFIGTFKSLENGENEKNGI